MKGWAHADPLSSDWPEKWELKVFLRLTSLFGFSFIKLTVDIRFTDLGGKVKVTVKHPDFEAWSRVRPKPSAIRQSVQPSLQ